MRRVWVGLALACALLPFMVSAAAAQEPKVLIYSGTVGYRHAGTGEAIQPAVVELIQAKLQAAGIASDYRTCNGQGTGAGRCPAAATHGRQPRDLHRRQPRAVRRDLLLAGVLAQPRRHDRPAAVHRRRAGRDRGVRARRRRPRAPCTRSVTMGAGAVTWPWWDAPGDSAIGALMPGHSATDANNIATVQVSDRNHPSTKDLPDSYRFGDEHYTFSSNVRGTHHVLMTLDEETYNVGNGVTRMGADHPIAWCRMYEGARIWASSLGHFSAAYLENGGDNNLIKHLVGGVRWVAGPRARTPTAKRTVWTNFSRTVLADDLRGAIGLDIARDGKVYWTEIGDQALQSEGRLRMYDPADARDQHAADAADPRRPRVLQRRRARDGAGPGLRDQPAALHLLLAAPGPGLQLVPDRRPQRHQPLHAQRRRHGGRGGLRAGDPARAQGQGRQRQPRRRRGPEHLQRARRRRQHQLRLRGRPLHRHRRRRRPVRRRAATATRRWTSATRSATTRATPPRTPTTCAARSCASARWPTRRAPPASARRTRSRPGTCSRPARRRRSPRSSPWASATRSRSRPTRRARARSWSATTARTRRPTTPRAARPASSSGTASPGPASTAGRCARATTRPPTATSATRSRAARPARASTARRRRSPTSRRTTPA